MAVEDEMKLDTQFWQKHYDIMTRQEADLVEILSRVNFYFRCLPEYSEYTDETVLKNRISLEELQGVAAAGIAIDDREKNFVVSNDEATEEWLYNEDIVEKRNEEELIRRATLAANHPIVNKYGKMIEVTEGDVYPASFGNLVPVTILNSMFYCRYHF